MDEVKLAAYRLMLSNHELANVCGCMGPQNGEPLCPCRMRDCKQIDGRWVKAAQDLGPVKITPKEAVESMRPLLERWKS